MRASWVFVMMVAGCQAGDVDETEALSQGNQPELFGDVTVYGCTPQVADVAVVAAPVVVATGNTSGGPAKRRAHITATADPHVFQFRFPGTNPHHAYRLAAHMEPGAPCAKTAWQGPAGFVNVGGPALHISAFAMTTQIEVQGLRDGNPVWLGIDAINFDDPNGGAMRALRWRSDRQGVAAGLVEIAVDRLVPGVQPRVIATYQVPAASPNQQGGWTELPAFDFGQLLVPPCLQQNNCQPPCDPQQDPNCVDRRSPLAAVQNELRHGAPIYVHVVPLDGLGHRLEDAVTGGISSYVKLGHLAPVAGSVPPPPPPPPVPPMLFHIRYDEASNTYALPHNGGCFRTVEDHASPPDACNFSIGHGDFYACFLAGMFPLGSTIPAGSTYCVNHDDDGWFSDFWDALSGFVDAIGAIVDGIAHLYEEIKADVADAIASVLDELPGGCGDICHTFITAALETGLAAMGLPPSLPSWEELKAEGIDYLEEEAAEESGVFTKDDIELVRMAVGEALDNMKTGAGSGGLPAWIEPDDGFRPVRLTLDVRRNPDFTGPDAPDQLAFGAFSEFAATTIDLPHQAIERGETIHVPVEFLPDTSGFMRLQWCPFGPDTCQDIPPLTAEHLEDDWFNFRYLLNPCATFVANGNGIGSLGGAHVKLEDFGTVMSFFINAHSGSVSSDDPMFHAVCP
jgi:hypothetical protein